MKKSYRSVIPHKELAMRRFFLILVLLAILLMAWVVSAQNGFPAGYQTVYTAPAAGMHPLNYTCTMTTYDASNGMAKTSVSAEVDAYIVWINPARPAEY